MLQIKRYYIFVLYFIQGSIIMISVSMKINSYEEACPDYLMGMCVDINDQDPIKQSTNSILKLLQNPS